MEEHASKTVLVYTVSAHKAMKDFSVNSLLVSILNSIDIKCKVCRRAFVLCILNILVLAQQHIV